MSSLPEIFAWLAQKGGIYLVGGSLRQLLLGKPVKDYDFVVAAGASVLAKELARQFRLPCFPLDKERDMARVVLPGLMLDFAPYGEDLNQDLRLRDLSINAMACPVMPELLTGQSAGSELEQLTRLLENSIIDPCLGLEDLRQRQIRAVERANLEADPLRLLRVYRFAAKLHFDIEPKTAVWVRQLAGRIETVAAERILQEMLQILLTPQAAAWIERMQTQNLLPFLPQPLFVQQLHSFEDLSSQLDQTFSKYLEQNLTVERPRLFAFKLGALLLGLDSCKAPSADDPLPMSAEQRLETLLSTLALGRRELDCLLLWQRLLPELNDLLTGFPDPIGKRFWLYRRAGKELPGLLLLGRIAVVLGLWQDSEQWLARLEQEWHQPQHPIAHPPALIDGHQLMQALQLKPGPQVGKLLLEIQEAQARQMVNDREQALAFARQRLNEINR